MPSAPRRPVVPDDLRPHPDHRQQAVASAADPDLVEIGAQVGLRRYLAQLWEHREFALTVPLGQLQARNQDTMLGRAWYLLNPMLLIAIYYLIFQVILGIEGRRGVENFLPFLTVGVIVYGYTRSSVQSGASSVVRSRRLVRSLFFPRTILPLGVLIAQTTTYLYALGTMLVLVLLMGEQPSWRWLLLPVALAIQAVLNLGLALFAARFTFHFRDFSNLLPFVLRLGLYVSGVIIPINDQLVPQDPLRWLLQANPVYNVLEMNRQLVLGTSFEPRVWIVGTLWAAVLLVAGFVYFRRAEDRYSGV